MSTPTASSTFGSTANNRDPLPSSDNSEKGKGTLTDWLHAELQKTVRHLQFLETTANVAWWWCTLLAVLVVAITLDHWLWVLPTFARYLFWLTGIGLSMFWLLRRILPLFIFRIHPLYAAKIVEEAIPELKNRLISWWELKHEPQSAPRGVVAAVGRQAVAQLRTHDSSALLDTRPMIIAIGIALSLTVFVSLYSLVAPRSAWTTAERILFPWKTIAPPARVKINQVQPGSSVVPQSLPCPIFVEASGLLSDEKVFVRFTSADRQILDQRLELAPKIVGSTYEGTLTTDGRGVQQDVEYWIEAGDTVAGPYSLKVNPLPQWTIDKIRLTYPAYTKLPASEQTADGNIEAVEGTLVELNGSLSGEANKSFIEFFSLTADGKPQRSLRSQPMSLEGSQGKAAFTVRLNGQKDNPTLETYTLRAIDAGGNSEPNPLFYPLRVTGDFAPEIQLTASSESPLKASSKGSLSVQINALDPDFGLANVDLEIRKGNFVLETLKLLEQPEGVRDPWNKKFQIRLAKWRLQSGEKLTLTAIAKDNRRQPGTDTLEQNVTRSSSLEVEITEPTPAEKNNNSEDPPKEDKSPIEEVTEDQKPDQNQRNSEKPSSNSSENGKKSESGSSGSGSSSSGGSQSESQNSDSNSGDSTSSSDSANSSKPNTGNNAGEGQSGEDSPAKPSSNNSSGGDGKSEPSENNNANNDPQQQNSEGNSEKNSEGNRENANSKPSSAESGEGNNAPPPDHDGDIMERIQERMQREQSKNSNNNAQAGNEQPNSKPNPSSENNSNSKQSRDGMGESSDDKSKPQTGSPNDANSKPADDTKSGDDSSSGDNNKSEVNSKPGDKSQQGNDSKPGSDSQPGNDPKQGSDPKQGNDSQAGNDNKQGNNSQQGDNSKSGNDSKQGNDGKAGADPQSGNSDSKQGTDSKDGSDSKDGTDSKSGTDSQKGSDSKEGSDSKDSPDSKNGSDSKQEGSNSKPGNESQAGSDSKPSSDAGDPSNSKSGSDSMKGSDGKDGSDSKQPAGSEQGENAGDKNEGNGKPEGSGDQKGGGNSAEQSKAAGDQNAQQQNADPQNKAGQQNAGQQNAGQQNAGQAGENPGNQSNSNANPGMAEGQRNGTTPGDNSQGVNTNDGAAAANLDYAKEATNLALDYLERQKDQPDPELLKEMNWSKEDLNRFLDRWKKTMDNLDKNKGEREMAEQDLRSLGLRPSKNKAGAVAGSEDQLRNLQDAGPRVAPPKSLKSQFESVKKALQQRQTEKSSTPR
jgi:hypothetical protein